MSVDRARLIEEIAKVLQDRFAKEGLAEYLRARLSIDVDPAKIRHKRAYLEAVLPDLPTADLLRLGQDLGIEVPTERTTDAGQIKKEAAESTSESSPHTWAGLAFWFASRPRRIATGVAISLLLLAAAAAAGRLFGYDILGAIFPRLATVKSRDITDPSLQACLDEAKRRGKPYVLLAVTQLVEIRDTPAPAQHVSRQAIVRMVYTLLMLKDVKRESDAEFFESFTSDRRAVIDRWYGTERETSDADGTSYDVLFTARAGETYTVVTGATYNMSLPLPPRGSAFSQNTSLATNEDTWGYPNVTNGGDVIRELTIVLWSPTTRLLPVGQAAKHARNRTVTGADVVVNDTPSPTTTAVRSLSARWTNVMPNDEVGIHFSW